MTDKDPYIPYAQTIKEQLSVVNHPQLYPYLLENSLREPSVLTSLREETIKPHPKAVMASAPDEVQFLTFLLETIGAKRVVEVGVFLGYSTLAFALAVPSHKEGGKVVGLDISEEFAAQGKKYWAEAGVADKIELVIGPAVESLKKLIEQEGQAESYDFAYIDADKAGYDAYYELCLKLVRPGGIVAVDNTFRHGRVLCPKADDADTMAVWELNKKIHKDERVTIAMLPVSDGLTLCRKRGHN